MTPQYTDRPGDGPDPARIAGQARSAAQPRLHDVVQLARQVCDAPIAALSLAGPGGLAIHATAGLDGRGTDEMHPFLALAARASGLIEIADLRTHSQLAGHRLVVASPGLRACAGIALLGAHHDCVGSLCVLDRRRRALDFAQRDALAALARMAVALVEAPRPEPGVPTASRVEETRRGWEMPAPRPSAVREDAADRYAVAIVELDGHSVAAPMAVMQRMQAVAADVIGRDDVLSRDGPRELLVVCTQAEQAPVTLDRLAAALSALPERPRVAIGAALGRHDRDAMEDVFLVAESALQRARLQRGVGVVFAAGSRPSMNA